MHPLDPNRASLPDPIPASLYARAAGPTEPRPAGQRLPELAHWRRLAAEARGWPAWKQVLVAAAGAAGLVLLVLSPWRPALALLAVVVPAAVLLGVDAWGLRRRAPVLGSANELTAAGGWAVIAGLLLLGVFLAVPGGVGAPRGADSGLAAGRNRTAAASPSGVPVVGPPSASPSPTPRPSPTPSPTPRPTPTLGAIRLLDAPLSTTPGGRVTLQAQTAPNTDCTLSAGYTGGPHLLAATSDDTGAVSWSWRVARQAPTGVWPITVVCGSNTVSTQITVTNNENG
ncbi:MAG TPA: hypothetical protein VKF59_11845 [Candidatus Dormibacteraeota bacterium]|nr:hypothetical protein [Candidatus Dormibacteraeota bacterium]